MKLTLKGDDDLLTTLQASSNSDYLFQDFPLQYSYETNYAPSLSPGSSQGSYWETPSNSTYAGPTMGDHSWQEPDYSFGDYSTTSFGQAQNSNHNLNQRRDVDHWSNGQSGSSHRNRYAFLVCHPLTSFRVRFTQLDASLVHLGLRRVIIANPQAVVTRNAAVSHSLDRMITIGTKTRNTSPGKSSLLRANFTTVPTKTVLPKVNLASNARIISETMSGAATAMSSQNPWAVQARSILLQRNPRGGSKRMPKRHCSREA